MKAKSISEIREILQKRVSLTKVNYQAVKTSLEEKYHTEWLSSVMTEQEKELLYDYRQAYYEATGLLEDFEDHEW